MKNIVYVFILGLLLCGCASDEEKFITGTLAGSVSDQSTGEPVATVNVFLTPGGQSTITGSDGSFIYSNLEAGTYTIKISKEGYRSTSSQFRVIAGKSTSAHLLIERIPATITPDREVLDFGKNESVTMLSFGIVNTNYAALEYTLEYDCKWIKEVKPTNGTLETGKTGTVIVNIDRSQLGGGNNETVIVVKTSNGRAEIKLTAIGAEKSLPVLNVLNATEIGSTTAILNAEIIESGMPNYTERGFVYSLTSAPTMENTLAKVSAEVNDKSKYSCTLDGLIVGETYYVRAYAINSVGIAYSSNEIHFTTKTSLPQVTVQLPTDINVATGSAVLHGTMEELGTPAATEQGFVYSLLSLPTIEDTKVISPTIVKGTYHLNVTDLPLDKTIYVRSYAKSEVGVAYSDTSVVLSTYAIAPQVTTMEAQDVDMENGTATFVGRIDNAGTPEYIERGFVYSTMHDPTVNDNKIVANGTGEGRFSLYATGLPKNKPFYVRAYAKSERAGTVYGDEVVVGKLDWVILAAAGIAVQKQDLGRGAWDTANSMCENSILGGYTDWRLPTKEELMVLYNNRELIGGFEDSSYWSSTSYGYSSYYYISFGTGSLYTKDSVYSCRVRAVRTLAK